LGEVIVKPRHYQLELKLQNIRKLLPLIDLRKIPGRRLKEE
jgi:hypothetical protein